MYALVDCNNFYASCERVFRPELNGQPIVVLSNNDGCVIARSNESKELNIPMGAPAFKYKQLFKHQKINVFSSNYALYGDMSARVMQMLTHFAPEIEIYSIDEAFLHYNTLTNIDFHKLGKTIQKDIFRSTGIPVSIGFGKSKALAKVANRIAKKFVDRTNNIYVIDTELKRIKALKWLKIGDVWGIGRQLCKRLQYYNIHTAMDLIQKSDAWVRKTMSVVELRLKKDLEGQPTIQIQEIKKKQSIATTRSFDKDYTTFEEIRERIVTFSVHCANKLRQQQSCCSNLYVFIRSNSFKQDQPQYRRGVTIQLPYPTNSSMELAQFAVQALKSIFRTGFQYKKAGVIVSHLTPQHKKQLTLFQASDPRHQKLLKVVDTINQNLGDQKIRLASQAPGRTWIMRQERLSPKYTTKLSDIIHVY